MFTGNTSNTGNNLYSYVSWPIGLIISKENAEKIVNDGKKYLPLYLASEDQGTKEFAKLLLTFIKVSGEDDLNAKKNSTT